MQFLHKLAGGGHGEVSDATIQGYLRAASQIEDIWKRIDEQVDELIGQGLAPWDAYARMGYPLAFVRACRMNVVFVQFVLKDNIHPAGAHECCLCAGIAQRSLGG